MKVTVVIITGFMFLQSSHKTAALSRAISVCEEDVGMLRPLHVLCRYSVLRPPRHGDQNCRDLRAYSAPPVR